MAILKYTNSNGEIITVNQYKVNNVIVSQEKGNSETDVMSQKAVTDELNILDNKIENIDIPEIDLSEYATKEEVSQLNSKIDNSVEESLSINVIDELCERQALVFDNVPITAFSSTYCDRWTLVVSFESFHLDKNDIGLPSEFELYIINVNNEDVSITVATDKGETDSNNCLIIKFDPENFQSILDANYSGEYSLDYSKGNCITQDVPEYITVNEVEVIINGKINLE